MWHSATSVVDEIAVRNLLGPITLAETPKRLATHRSSGVAKLIYDAWVDSAAVIETFGGREVFGKTVDKIDQLDTRFRRLSGTYFDLGSNAAAALQSFEATQLEYRQTGVRPSLPTQVAHYLKQIALSGNDPYYQAAVLVAARAEVEHVSRPEYHSVYHFSDVIAGTAEFLRKNNALAAQAVPGAVRLSQHELAMGIIAAAGHDMGHPGGKNSLPGERAASDPFRLERQSVSLIEPLLKAAGIPGESIAKINVAILTTSPDTNGPRKLLREIDGKHQARQRIIWRDLAENDRFPELRLAADDPAVRVISQNLRCADLGQSCMFGLRSHEIATHALQTELRIRGYGDQLLGDSRAQEGPIVADAQTLKARKAFLDFAAYGEVGPDAAGARAAAGANYADLYAGTKRRLAAALDALSEKARDRTGVEYGRAAVRRVVIGVGEYHESL